MIGFTTTHNHWEPQKCMYFSSPQSRRYHVVPMRSHGNVECRPEYTNSSTIRCKGNRSFVERKAHCWYIAFTSCGSSSGQKVFIP